MGNQHQEAIEERFNRYVDVLSEAPEGVKISIQLGICCDPIGMEDVNQIIKLLFDYNMDLPSSYSLETLSITDRDEEIGKFSLRADEVRREINEYTIPITDLSDEVKKKRESVCSALKAYGDGSTEGFVEAVEEYKGALLEYLGIENLIEKSPIETNVFWATVYGFVAKKIQSESV